MVPRLDDLRHFKRLADARFGHASRLDEYGSLMVVDAAGPEHVVTAGEVVHLRPWTAPGSGTGPEDSGSPAAGKDAGGAGGG